LLAAKVATDTGGFEALAYDALTQRLAAQLLTALLAQAHFNVL